MASNIDWTDWILQKNNEAQAEELNKNSHVEVSNLEKAKPKTETIKEFQDRGGKINKLPVGPKSSQDNEDTDSNENSFKDNEHGEGKTEWGGRDIIADTQLVREINKK